MEDFDYRLRPAKSIERKMLAEAISRLFTFGKPSSFQYIGFGAIWFNDFILFHKALGFDKMISIEKDAHLQKRFEFNRPLNCIDLKFGHSNMILPTLNWKNKTVLWLDYVCGLNDEVLKDISLVSSQMTSGSLLIISVNAEPRFYKAKKEDDPEQKMISGLKTMVGENRVPNYVKKEADMNGWNTADICRDIFTNEIEETLKIRNGVIADDTNKFRYQQLYNFRYKDGARMATFGGVVFQEKDLNRLESCAFDHFEFYRSGTESYYINPPLLTFREIHALEKIVHSDRKEAKKIPIEADKIEDYIKLHRYFPTFAITEI